jgi:hypothetical protein
MWQKDGVTKYSCVVEPILVDYMVQICENQNVFDASIFSVVITVS